MTGRPTRRPAGTWTTDDIRRTVVHTYTVEQHSIRQIAASIGAPYTTVHTILTNAAITKRTRSGTRRRRRGTPTGRAPR